MSDWNPAPRDSRPMSPSRPEPAWRQLLPRLIFGSGLVVAGVLFTLDNMGAVDADDYLRLWPLLLVALGIGQLVGGRVASDWISGTLWTVAGVWLLLYELGWIRYSIFDLWPLVLVAFGGSLILRAMRPRKPSSPSDDSSTHAFALMSGLGRKSSSASYSGGSLTAIMGGVDLDLTQAMLGDDRRATIDMLAFWGGIEIRVPPTWRVTSRIWPIMGGYEDKTSPPPADDAEGELEVTGYAIMGGVEIKN